MKDYGVHIATSHIVTEINVGSWMENFKANIGNTKVVLQRESISSCYCCY